MIKGSKASKRANNLITIILTVVSFLYIYPIFMILMNSFKDENAISTSRAFEIPDSSTFVGLKNYIYGITEMDFLKSFGYSVLITVTSVALIMICCSMCAWYITRVDSILSKGMYIG